MAVGRVHVDEVLRERPEGRANHLEEMLVALVLAGGGELVTVERRATACHVGGQPPPLQRRQEAAGGGVHSVVGVAEGEMMDAVGASTRARGAIAAARDDVADRRRSAS